MVSKGCGTDPLDKEYLFKNIAETEEFKQIKLESENYRKIMRVFGISKDDQN